MFLAIPDSPGNKGTYFTNIDMWISNLRAQAL